MLSSLLPIVGEGEGDGSSTGGDCKDPVGSSGGDEEAGEKGMAIGMVY